MALSKDDLLAEARSAVNPVDAAAAEALLANGAVVLDVREPAEFDMGHLPGAVNVPRGVLEFRVGDHPALTNPQAEILLYCKNGGRSTLAAYTLKRMGFEQVKMLVGGFDGWSGTVHKVEVDPSVYR
ncbi:MULTISPECIES: rhodanese-like domain-containing protein [Oceanospirillaceae]|jgi:rhodanese-related sulfurtransferase|uniref:rhodanese-like domain-containing protein n=1 Tax=Oceanospirillaceae TaxID=135620 RepID=UPI000C677D2A|nr:MULTISPECIES: rhodanese-like domain-containing protein [Thalassolituus]MAY14166.1 sulfurtransferase [Oceanospirillaceae bacterium]PIQ39412.1 MAG: sulfurtransferase [Thalassolituus sp. CG17_big_fil_post_rev_8_21_14_2_50_53_8]MCA6061201.1 rhodanese-like domain-containing protein [Thalassolituus sp. ST750PaO-4]MCB2388105.1 rhodanese-like domain-containing protein [Thalassolituus alkanivorans]MCB2424644.1 rhodanese-like domain-containing protein [Thalassolituus alkanivorans]